MHEYTNFSTGDLRLSLSLYIISQNECVIIFPVSLITNAISMHQRYTWNTQTEQIKEWVRLILNC